jgi:hypothetical protein
MRSRYEGPGLSGPSASTFTQGIAAAQPRAVILSARSLKRGSIVITALIIVAVLQYILYESANNGRLGGFANVPVINDANPFDGAHASGNTPSVEKEWDHLIMVPGHSVIDITAMDPSHMDVDSMWKLLDYQENQGLPEAIASHIAVAINTTVSTQKSILIFSGGETRRDAGPISEGLSYYIYAKQKGLLDGIESRVYTEEFSRDSFENLLFSICRFKEITGHYPDRVTVIGFDFKEYRFTSLHRRAMHFPANAFSYIGIAPPSLRFDRARAETGEKEAFQAFQTNMYGCAPAAHGETAKRAASLPSVARLRGSVKANSEPPSGELLQKRLSRNPFKRGIPYESSCPEIADLLRWCGPSLYPHKSNLPWVRASL